MARPSGVVEAAGRIADDVLFPAAIATDGADAVPAANLDALADAGLYGLAGPPEFSGHKVDFAGLCSVVESLAGGCLATTFVWIQHHGLVRTLAADSTSEAVRDEWLEPLCRGQRRAGLALTGLLPGPPLLTAEPVTSGRWRLEGTAPWVTGWGLVDVLQVVARGPGETVVWMMVDAAETSTLTARRVPLVAADASVTVRLDFTGLTVPAERVLRVEPFGEGSYNLPAMLRLNGSLALGVAGRAARLLTAGPDLASGLRAEIDRCRMGLDAAAPEQLPVARAAASALATRTTSLLVVDQGGKAICRDHHAQRLAREALFLLVFATRPPIRAALLDRLAPND